LPVCDALSEQVPVLAVMVTMAPEFEQAPEEVMVTASPEVAEAVTLKELP
jgi:hypothetical protein